MDLLSELRAILAADLPLQDDQATLTEILYSRCYIRSIADPEAGPRGVGFSPPAKADLTAALQAANRSQARWVEGWSVDQILNDGRIVARRNGTARAFLPGEYITHLGIGTGAKEGAEISVYAAAGSKEIQETFYYAFGETVSDSDPAGSLLRFYWNIQPAGAPRLMECLTREFNKFQVPFHFKCLSQASEFPRRDAAVLYLDRRYFHIAALLLESIHGEMLSWLNAPTPLFARRLAHGLALAEDPEESFGKNRCRILAEAMAASCGKPVDERLAELRLQFERRGLSLEAPWLNAHSPGDCEYPISIA
jgi:hypothetical protein